MAAETITPNAPATSLFSQRRRRDIFVASHQRKITSSVGAAYSDVAPTGLGKIWEVIATKIPLLAELGIGVGIFFWDFGGNRKKQGFLKVLGVPE
jgi:hypothetical protein